MPWIEELGPKSPDYIELRFAMADLFERYGEADVALAFIFTRSARNRLAANDA